MNNQDPNNSKPINKSIHRTAILIVILIIAGFLRLYDLPSNPAGFFPDEASTGYDAWCLLTCGIDQHGQVWPFFFRSFADDLCGTYRYLVLASTYLLGPSVLATRIPMALAGILTVFFIYKAVRNLVGFQAAAFSTFLFAVSPWHLPYCRTGQRIMLLPLGLSIWFFVWSRAKKHNFCTLFHISWFILGLSIYTYVAARIIIPSLALIIGTIELVVIRRKFIHLFTSILIFCVALTPIIVHLFDNPSLFSMRFNQVSIFNQSASTTEACIKITKNHLSHFGIDFLFADGDANYRHSQRGFGELLWCQAPLIILGLFRFVKRRSSEGLVIIAWLLISPLPAALSLDGNPHALRSVAGLAPWIFLTASGIQSIIDQNSFKKAVNLALLIIVIIGVLEGIWVGIDLLIFYPEYSASAWEFGTREAVHQALTMVDEYPEIWFTKTAIGADRIIAYELLVPCPEFASSGLKTTPFRWNWLFSAEMIRRETSSGKRLLVVRENEVSDGREAGSPILRPDGSIAFKFITFD